MNGTIQSTAADRPAGRKLLAYLQLFRAPNVFTSIADVTMGYVITQGAIEPFGIFALLSGTSIMLYSAGMVFNDVYDVDQDSLQRPERPIPSGRIARGMAKTVGLELLILGLGLAWLASILVQDLRPGAIATVLAACVWLYDVALKSTPLGPVAMGGCRALNVLLGMSAASMAWEPAHGAIALALGVYIGGVTWFARTETQHSGRLPLALATLLMAVGIGLFAASPFGGAQAAVPDRWGLLWAVVGFLVLWRCFRAVIRPTPLDVQMAVKHCIFGIFMIDAAACLPVQSGGVPIWSMGILALSIPAMILGRWVAST